MTPIDVRELGAKGDGVTDDTAIISAAIALGIARRVPVEFPPGVYLVTGPIVDPSARHYTLYGISSARGCNAVPQPWAGSTIKFRPSDPTRWLISVYTLGDDTSKGYLGPFEHRDLAFDLGDANGLRFGLEDTDFDGESDPVEDNPANGVLQAYITNVRFDGCAFGATWADRAIDGNGMLNRSGRTLLHLTKCFESVVTNTSFAGGDTQVRTWGCDTPTFVAIRSQGAHLPFALHGSGTFGARHTLRDVQVEGWTFTPVQSHACETVIESGRFEQNDGAPPGSGRHDLGTATVVRGDAILVFPQSMEGILFPGLSLIEVQSSGQSVAALVDSVFGPTVTVRDVTSFPWSDPDAAVTRLHGYGPIHDSIADCHVTDCHGNASLNCPAYVYVLGRGTMHIRAGGTLGNSVDNRSLPIGNRCLEQCYLNGHMGFTGTSAAICGPPPEHPLAVVSGLSEDYGFDAIQPNARAPLGSLDTAIASVSRVWALTPKHSGSYANTHGVNCIPFVEVPGDPHTAQRIWCWQIGCEGQSQGLVCGDPTLPGNPEVMLRIRFRARSVSRVGVLKWRFLAALWEPIGPVQTLPFPPTWTTRDLITSCPTVWQDARRSESVGFFIEAEGVYLAGVTVEEIRPAVAIVDATDAASTTAQLDALLAVLRANGTIVPTRASR